MVQFKECDLPQKDLVLGVVLVPRARPRPRSPGRTIPDSRRDAPLSPPRTTDENEDEDDSPRPSDTFNHNPTAHLRISTLA